jgi:hypothetical protein
MTLDISTLYANTSIAKLADLPTYEAEVKRTVPPGADVTLTGPGPVWLYLRLAHTLHGIARSLRYDSPVTGSLVIFDHNPY